MKQSLWLANWRRTLHVVVSRCALFRINWFLWVWRPLHYVYGFCTLFENAWQRMKTTALLHQKCDIKRSSRCLCGFKLHGCVERKDFRHPPVPYVNILFVHIDRLSVKGLTEHVPKRIRFWDIFVFVMYYVYGVSRPSLLIELYDKFRILLDSSHRAISCKDILYHASGTIVRYICTKIRVCSYTIQKIRPEPFNWD